MSRGCGSDWANGLGDGTCECDDNEIEKLTYGYLVKLIWKNWVYGRRIDQFLRMNGTEAILCNSRQ